MAAMTSFYAEKWCHLVSEHEVTLGSYASPYASSRSIVHLYLLLWRKADIVYMCCISSCVDNERSSGRLDACTAHVSWRFSRHLVHLLAWCQHVWMEVVRGQPCLDIWTWSSKSSHTPGIYGGHSCTLQCVLNIICFVIDAVGVIKCWLLLGKISLRCSANSVVFICLFFHNVIHLNLKIHNNKYMLSMSVFWGRLQVFLLRRSYPWIFLVLCSACAVTVVIYGHLNCSFLLTSIITLSNIIMCKM